MGVMKVRGIVIKETSLGEADKFITVFAKNLGKIEIFAKGASNIKSKFLAGTSLFTYGDFIIRSVSKTTTLNSVEVIEKFYNITKNLDSYYCGMYLLEFINKVIGELTDDNRYLQLLLKSLSVINNKTVNPILAVRIFEIKILKYLGYNPYNDYCVQCGKENPDNFTINGLLCNNCSNSISSKKLTPGALYTLKYIDYADLSKLFKFNIDNNIFSELSFISEKYINYHLECKLKTYEFIRNFTIDKTT